MQELNSHLTLRSYVVGYSQSAADLVIWSRLRGNKIAYASLKRGNSNITRWFNFVEATNPWLSEAVQELNDVALHKRAVASAEGGSYDIGIDFGKHGCTTRFPPEPSYDVPKMRSSI